MCQSVSLPLSLLLLLFSLNDTLVIVNGSLATDKVWSMRLCSQAGLLPPRPPLSLQPLHLLPLPLWEELYCATGLRAGPLHRGSNPRKHLPHRHQDRDQGQPPGQRMIFSLFLIPNQSSLALSLSHVVYLSLHLSLSPLCLSPFLCSLSPFLYSLSFLLPRYLHFLSVTLPLTH